jgi:hypothetical protein
MAGIKTVQEFYQKLGSEKFNEAISSGVTVTSKPSDNFKFYVKKKDGTFVFHGNNFPRTLDKIERTLTDVYEPAIMHFEALSTDILKSIPENTTFSINWNPSSKKLKLFNVSVLKEGIKEVKIKSPEVLQRWCNVLKIEKDEPVFTGKLNESQIKGIYESLDSGDQLLFDTPVVVETSEGVFKLGEIKESVKENRQLYELLLLSIFEHLESIDIEKIRVGSTNPEESYIEAVCEVFNRYVSENGLDFVSSGIERPVFLSKMGKLNKEWISNRKTIEIIESDSKYEYLLSVFLASCRRPRSAGGLITEAVATKFNKKIESINQLTGSDYSFLEFSSIFKEDAKEEIDVPAKAVVMTQVFFDGKAPAKNGERINVLVADLNVFTDFLVDYAESLYTKNGCRVFLLHAKDILGTEQLLSKQDINTLINEITTTSEAFMGGGYGDHSILSMIVEGLHEYRIAEVHTEKNYVSMSVEVKGMKKYRFIETEVFPYRDQKRPELFDCIKSGNSSQFNSLAYLGLRSYFPLMVSKMRSFLTV